MMIKRIKIKNKGAQVTIFIILALALIVSIAIIFVLNKPKKPIIINEKNPQTYIESCIKDSIEESLEILSEQGGDIFPENSIMYQDKNISYLCYIQGYYTPCINQRPHLISNIEKEIKEYASLIIDNCFSNLESELSNKYEIEIQNSNEMQVNINLRPNQVLGEVNRKIIIKNEKNTREFKKFKVNLVHPIYNLAKIALEITNQEAQYCNFEILGFMLFYPKYNINKFRTGDSDTIYTITERISNKKFIFAVRGCVLPPGFF